MRGARKKTGRSISWTMSELSVGINADQWTTAAQDEGKWRRTAEQGAEHFMVKRIAAEKAKAGLRHAVVCTNVTGRTKRMIAHSKQPRAS